MPEQSNFSNRSIYKTSNSFYAQDDASDLILPTKEAVAEIQFRQLDSNLKQHVEKYLGGVIPEHFANGPILYMARHVATPNFETLRFLHIHEPRGLKIVIGQDPRDLFVTQNTLKRSLGKLPIFKGITRNEKGYHEQYQMKSIIDFNASNGRAFNTISTLWGEGIVDFHRRLFSKVTEHPVCIEDDSIWIDQNHRGNMLEHYKKFLALFLYHGVLFEDFFFEEDKNFVETILRPAVEHIEAEFGYQPLISQLNPNTLETDRFWISYPKKVLDVITSHL